MTEDTTFFSLNPPTPHPHQPPRQPLPLRAPFSTSSLYRFLFYPPLFLPSSSVSQSLSFVYLVGAGGVCCRVCQFCLKWVKGTKVKVRWPGVRNCWFGFILNRAQWSEAGISEIRSSFIMLRGGVGDGGGGKTGCGVGCGGICKVPQYSQRQRWYCVCE